MEDVVPETLGTGGGAGNVTANRKRPTSEDAMTRSVFVASPFMGLGLYVVYASLSMSIWSYGPEEGFLPFTLGCALVGLSGVFFFQELRAGDHDALQDEPVAYNKAVYYYTAVLLFYSLTLQPLGFLLSTAISLTILLRWLEGESWRTTTLIAVGFNVLFYLFFSILLGVSLPRGPF